MVHDLTISTSLLFYCKYQCLLPVLRAAHVSVSSVNDMLCPVFCLLDHSNNHENGTELLYVLE